ncbi:hypothetical protein C8R44DRAFT_977758 [Mycena epipterygia]|nr:hypothetical protein C8R44DRAFT_977758 [Mycena epipterygia]
MDFLTALPVDLLYNVGLHIPTTRDLFSLSLANQYSRNSLNVPILFKWRLENNGWDVALWEKNYTLENLDERKSEGSQWFKIDYIHSCLEELFEHAITDDSTITLLPTAGNAGSVNPSTNQGDEILRWLEDLSRFLPAVLLHHTSRNIPRLTQVKYWPVWNTILRTADELCSAPHLPTFGHGVLNTSDPIKAQSDIPRQLARETLDLLALGLATVFHSAESTQLLEMHGSVNLSKVIDGFSRSPGLFGGMLRASRSDIRLYRRTVSSQLSSVLVASSFLRLKLLVERARPEVIASNSRSILPPSPPLPSPDIANFRWIDIIDPQTRHTGFLISILDVLNVGETPWCGYYTQIGQFDPPMRMSLRRSPTNGTNSIAFHGSGSDHVGGFSIQGNIELASGLLEAKKTYTPTAGSHQWSWSGLVTPFGLVGRWGSPEVNDLPGGSGWWWIWPAQWAPRPKVGGK